MVVYPKLLYNGAEGTVLENVTLKFEIFDNFASFFWFWPKKIPGGVPTSQGGCPVIKNFPRGMAPPSIPPDRSASGLVQYHGPNIRGGPQGRT